MTDSNGGDVERHYRELRKQLLEDGFAEDSQVMKMTEKLRLALHEDGFSLDDEPVAAETADEDEPTADMPPPVIFESEEIPASPTSTIVRAFRAKDAFDSNVVVSVFAAIDGWRTKVIQRGENHFIIATNAKSLTDAHVKQALTDYATEVRRRQATV